MTAARARRTRVQHTVTAWQRGRHTGAIKGAVRVVHPVLKQLGIRWMWDAKAGAYLVPIQRVDDVLAALEREGCRTDYRMPGW